MKFIIAFAALVLAVAADRFTERAFVDTPRSRRSVADLKYEGQFEKEGGIFGILGHTDDGGLFGRGGFKKEIFNDARGKFDASAHGTRVLGPDGDSSHFGGTLNWQNDNAKASLEASKQVHGQTSFNAAASGKWPVGNNGEVSAGGFYDKTSGMRPDYGAKAEVKVNF